jgi:hypothetical protein
MCQVPVELLSSAFFSLSREAAWPASDALRVIDWATTSQVAVFGVEVWRPTTPGPTIPTPFIYTFETRRRDVEDWECFVDRANSAAAKYVASFEWDVKDKKHLGLAPYFNLTPGEG